MKNKLKSSKKDLFIYRHSCRTLKNILHISLHSYKLNNILSRMLYVHIYRNVRLQITIFR